MSIMASEYNVRYGPERQQKIRERRQSHPWSSVERSSTTRELEKKISTRTMIEIRTIELVSCG